MKLIYHKNLKTEQETKLLATMLASIAVISDVFCLIGPMGAGKSTFCRYFIQARYPHITHIPSPSFTLMEIYEDTICHSDIMRIENVEAIEQLGIMEAMQQYICLIEWAGKLPKEYYPINALTLSFTHDHTMTITGNSQWAERLNRLWKGMHP